MREKWSDERMDDLNRRVKNGFNRVDADLREIRAEIGGLRGEFHTEIGSLHRLILAADEEAILAEAAAGFERIAGDPAALAAYHAESREIEAAFDAPTPEW